MATHTQMSAEEYLTTRFAGPDPEYLDGQILERQLPDIPHSRAQRRLSALFDNLGKKLPLHAFPELHLRLGPRHYRIADLAIFDHEPPERIPSTPPLVAIEILSPDDTFREIQDKFEEYRLWGVPHLWFVDPGPRKIYVYSEKGLQEVPVFAISELGVEITAAAIWE